MPDEATQAPDEVQDTPTPDETAPENGKPVEQEQEPTVDWEQRYESLRPEYDRNNQLLAAARGEHGPEAQIEALQALGVDVEQEEAEESDEFEDPYDALERRQAALEQQIQERDEAAQEAEFQELEKQFIDATLDEIQGAENVTLSAQEKKWVETQAKANRLETGEPNLKGAFDDLKGIKSAARDEYLASKKAPKAPAGAVGEEKIDLSSKNKDKRNKWMAEQIAPALEDEGS